MIVCDSPNEAKRWLKPYHEKKASIGFVATMGALHEGHLSLLEHANKENEIVCSSIFVNPLQFNNQADFDNYPIELEKDIAVLRASNCDMVFTGSLTDFFPGVENIDDIKKQDPGKFATDLEGEFREGHFAGVKTIVKQLFSFVGDCNAYFGAKDFQQTLVVKELATQMGYPNIVVCPTIREENGLAMSSRNKHLSEDQKTTASRIYLALNDAHLAWNSGIRNAEKIKHIIAKRLEHDEISIEYIALKNPADWQQNLSGQLSCCVIGLVAVSINKIRLIDNMMISSRC